MPADSKIVAGNDPGESDPLLTPEQVAKRFNTALEGLGPLAPQAAFVAGHSLWRRSGTGWNTMLSDQQDRGTHRRAGKPFRCAAEELWS